MTSSPAQPAAAQTGPDRRRFRRFAAAGAASGALALAAVVVPTPAQACGCGGFVPPDGYEVAVNREVAAITWDGTTERILLSMDAVTDTPEAALLLPTPGPAEVALADAELFDALEEAIEPEEVVEYTWWPSLLAGAPAGGPPGVGAPGSPVDVLETVQLGPLEVTTLSASDADGLSAWLDEHGYVMGDGLSAGLMPYVTEGWYFVAVRLVADAQTLEGGLQPLDITFESSSLVYPMRLSAAAATDQFVRTYVFADEQVERTDASAETTYVDVRYAAAVDPAAVSNETFGELLAAAPYLTVTDQWFELPAEQIVSDFTFAPAPGATDYVPVTYSTRMREILGMPAGPALVGIGVVVLVGALVIIRRDRRGPRVRGSV